jgi:type IV secretion system protein VirD4
MGLFGKSSTDKFIDNLTSSDHHGSASWGTDEIWKRLGMEKPSSQGAFRVGRGWYMNEVGHALTVAPTGAGKGTTVIIPNLLNSASMSAVVVDPKGENAAITGPYRRARNLRPLYFNPWGLLDLPHHGINPFVYLDPENPRLEDDIDLIAELLVPKEADAGSNGAHFENRSRALIQALLYYLAYCTPALLRTPSRLRELLRDDLETVFEEMSLSDGADGLLRQYGKEFGGLLKRSEREAGSIISTAQSATDIFKGRAMQRAFERDSGFRFEDMREDRYTLYLMIPADKLQSHYRLTRLIVGLAMQKCVQNPSGGKVAFFLDEFPALGYLEIAERAFSTFRGFGVQCWPFVQDLSQLKQIYGDKWQTFVANATFTQFFGVNDVWTAEQVSKMLGQQTITTGSIGSNNGSNGGSTSTNLSVTGRPLKTPDEVMRDDRMIVRIRGENPLLFDRLPYFEDDFFTGHYCHNPFGPAEQGAMTWKEANALCDQLDERREAGEDVKIKDAWFSLTPREEVGEKSASERTSAESSKKRSWPRWPFISALGLGGLVTVLATLSPEFSPSGKSLAERFLVFGLAFTILGQIVALPVAAVIRFRSRLKKVFGWPLFTAIGLTTAHFVYLIGGTIHANGGTWVLDHIGWGGIFLREIFIFGVIWAILIGVRRIINRKS